MIASVLQVAAKDLRIELRARTAITRLLPFTAVVLVLFAFALDPDRGVLRQAAAGLFWVAVLFAAVLAVERGMQIEHPGGSRDGLLCSAFDPGAIFLGKTAAVIVQLLAVEAVLAVGAAVLYGVTLHNGLLLVAAALLGSCALATVGVLYGALASGTRSRETLLPLLLLPVASPVLIAATEASNEALGEGTGDSLRWLGLLAVFAFIYAIAGVLGFGALLEDG